MDNTGRVNDFLTEMGVFIGEKHLQLDSNGLCILSETGKDLIVIELPKGSPLIYLYTTLFPVPSTGDRAAFFEKLLIMNLYGLQTDEANIAIDPQYNVVVLYHSAYVDSLDAIRLRNCLAHFIETAKRIRNDWEQDTQPAHDVFRYPQIEV
ncbi:MAG: hypothetical protein A2Y14_04805 [Verrucomicrobia bacterium GWF2_51_19]|nr:MAG: hypothetical protein A2Y14_04805 [Verrucomicrobia bacterium GWF2_51_19]